MLGVIGVRPVMECLIIEHLRWLNILSYIESQICPPGDVPSCLPLVIIIKE